MARLSTEQRRQRAEARGRPAALLMRLTGRLPLTCNRWFGAILGWVAANTAARTYKLCYANVQRSFPQLEPGQLKHLAKGSIVETIKTAAEIASIWMQPYHRLRSYIVAVINMELMQQKYQQGKGVLLLLPHIGNWELMGSVIPQYFPYTAMYQPPDSASIDALMQQGRQREGTRLVPAARRGVAQLLKALRAGEVVTVLPDQVPADTRSGDWSMFFNQPVFTMTLVYKLIKNTDCEVVVGVAWRVSKGFEIEFIQPDAAIKSADQAQSLLAMNKSIENCVKQRPEQYQWEYNRFKRKGPRLAIADAKNCGAQTNAPKSIPSNAIASKTGEKTKPTG